MVTDHSLKRQPDEPLAAWVGRLADRTERTEADDLAQFLVDVKTIYATENQLGGVLSRMPMSAIIHLHNELEAVVAILRGPAWSA